MDKKTLTEVKFKLYDQLPERYSMVLSSFVDYIVEDALKAGFEKGYERCLDDVLGDE